MPKSLLGQAVNYNLINCKKLIKYTENGHVTIDNNGVENAIRPFVIGRKNWLFFGAPQGADASALFYSLVETAKANNFELSEEDIEKFVSGIQAIGESQVIYENEGPF